jgi:phage gp29-like protein
MARETDKTEITNEIATTAKDIDIFSGWLRRLENPDPVLRTEAGGKGLKLYDEVDRDPHAGSVLQTRSLSIVGKEWEIIPAQSAMAGGIPVPTPRDKEIAGAVTGILKGCNFNQARKEILQAVLYGFYVTEVLWEYKDGAIIIKKIIGKHPRRFSFTQARELRLLTPQNMIEGEDVPDRKFVFFTFDDSDNPYGKGLGRKLWWPVWFKKHGIKFWLIFAEKFGMPTTVGKYPQGTEPAQQQALLDALDAIQNETAVKIPDTMSVELLEAQRAGTINTYETLCAFMDRQISKAVLGQTATTEGTPGKLGNEQAQDDVKQDIIEADGQLLDECLNNSLIPWVVDYNFPGVTEYPKIKTHAQKKPDLKGRSEIDKTITKDIGVPVSKKYFYETYNIPEPAKGEETVAPPSPSPFKFAEKGRYTPEQESLEGLAAKTEKGATGAMSGILEPVREIILKAHSLTEIRDKIYGVYSDMDPRDLEDLVARAIYTADLYGRMTIEEKTNV